MKKYYISQTLMGVDIYVEDEFKRNNHIIGKDKIMELNDQELINLIKTEQAKGTQVSLMLGKEKMRSRRMYIEFLRIKSKVEKEMGKDEISN